ATMKQRQRRDPSLVAEGHRMVVYIPTDLLISLRQLAADRAVEGRGQISVGAVVRELLEEAVGNRGPRNGKRRGRDSNPRLVEPVLAPARSIQAVDIGTIARRGVDIELRRDDRAVAGEIANRP